MDHDDQVLDDAVVFNVHEVVDEFVIGCGVIFGKYLGQAGDARFDVMAIGVFRIFFHKLFDEVGAFWSGADEAHVSVEDIPDLRDFIKACCPDEISDFGNARIIFCRQLGAGVFFRINTHGTEFVDIIFFAKTAYPHLTVEDGSMVFQFDGDSYQYSKRQCTDSSYTGKK